MLLLALDTATPDTVVGVRAGDGTVLGATHVPAAGERPGHASQVLGLAAGLLDRLGATFAELDRVGVGVGPGTFTGLRIGVATGRGLAQSARAELVAVHTPAALAAGARDAAGPGRAVLACLDARRGEAFVTASRGGELLLGPRAAGPDALADLADPGALAVGGGALRFRAALEAAGHEVPPDDSPLHHVEPAALVALAADADPAAREDLLPDYVRAPDAVRADRR